MEGIAIRGRARLARDRREPADPPAHVLLNPPAQPIPPPLGLNPNPTFFFRPRDLPISRGSREEGVVEWVLTTHTANPTRGATNATGTYG